MKILNSIRKPFRYDFYNATLIIIGINIGIFMLGHVWRNLNNYLALNVILVVQGKMYWQFLTYMFAHGGFQHLFFNMLGLLIFGVSVERVIGSKEFILFYLVSGVFCGLISFLTYYFTGMNFVFLLGASGGLYAILLAYAVLFPQNQVFIWGIIPIPAPILVLIYAIIEFVSQFFNVSSNIAHMTHLAGFVGAWLYFLVRLGVNPLRVWKNAFRS